MKTNSKFVIKKIKKELFNGEEFCEYCGLCFKGKFMLVVQSFETYTILNDKLNPTTRWKIIDTKVIKEDSFENEHCNCNKYEILSRCKDKCVICGSKLFGHVPSIEEKVAKKCSSGNWCGRCLSGITAIVNRKKAGLD